MDRQTNTQKEVNMTHIQVMVRQTNNFVVDRQVHQKPVDSNRWLFIESVGWLRVLSGDIQSPDPLVPGGDIEAFAGEVLLRNMNEASEETVVLYFEKRNGRWYFEQFERPLVHLEESAIVQDEQGENEKMKENKEMYKEILDKAQTPDEFVLAVKTLILTQSPIVFEAIVESGWFRPIRSKYYPSNSRVIDAIKDRYSPMFLLNWACEQIRSGETWEQKKEFAFTLLTELMGVEKDQTILSKLIIAWKENEKERQRIAQLFFDWANALAEDLDVESEVRAIVSLIAGEIEQDLSGWLKNQPVFRKLAEKTELWRHFVEALEELHGTDATGIFLEEPAQFVLQQQPNWWTIFTRENPRVEMLSIIPRLPNAKEIIAQALRSRKRYKVGLFLLHRWLENTEPSWRTVEIREILEG